MLTLDVSEALGAHLASLHGAHVVTPDDAPAIAARAMLSALARAVPALAGLAAELEVRANRVSVTVPTPAGTVIVLSPAAVADPLRYAMTASRRGSSGRTTAKPKRAARLRTMRRATSRGMVSMVRRLRW